jgi:hypothetical protein
MAHRLMHVNGCHYTRHSDADSNAGAGAAKPMERPPRGA